MERARTRAQTNECLFIGDGVPGRAEGELVHEHAAFRCQRDKAQRGETTSPVPLLAQPWGLSRLAPQCW